MSQMSVFIPNKCTLLTPSQHYYAKGSAQREGLTAALDGFQKKAPLDVPIVVGGKEVNLCPSFPYKILMR